MVVLFAQKNGTYDPNYPIWAQIAAGWAVSVLVFASGFIAKAIVSAKKKKGFVEDEVVWVNEETEE
jgi:NSS family neurotransmitter:Na+ symporter